MINQSLLNEQHLVEEYLIKLLVLSGMDEEEIRREELRQLQDKLLDCVKMVLREASRKVNKLVPLVVERERGGLVFLLDGKEKVSFHGAQDKTLYLFFWKHRANPLSTADFLWAIKQDPAIRHSLLAIYKSIRGNGTNQSFLDLIDRIDETSLSQAISRINKALKEKIGEPVQQHYLIPAGSNELRSVKLPEALLHIQDPWVNQALAV